MLAGGRSFHVAPTKQRRIRKAVFPVAGFGTRVLPATKSIPKEMLTLVDQPVLQVVVDEAREAGIEHFIFVTGRNKQVIEDHFDMAYELEDTLQKRGKLEPLNELRAQRPPPAPPPSPASRRRSASATPSGAPATSSATNRSPFSCPT